MKFIFDMVHHNPGEPPFSTAFTDPAYLASYGFNGQVFKHLNCVATFAATGLDIFPEGTLDRAWLEKRTFMLENEIAAAKAQGLQVFYHIDLFVLPRRLVEHYRAEIYDESSGRISLDREKTRELHRLMFDELASRFPFVDGYIIRVGETYLFDTPYHLGNGAVPPVGPSWAADYCYEEVLRGEPVKPVWGEAQASAYVCLLQLLREEVCEKLGKYIFFRTWDIFPDKLHARLDHYLKVSDQIDPHPKLLFSIKHTALDFWRHVKVNECLGRGRHPQVVEVQCQREYEGKGAYPNYFMHGLLDGFEENARCIGLRELAANPLIQGIYSWSRGGGWFGPYIVNELWPDINMYVLGQFARDPSQSEEDLFQRYTKEKLRLREADVEKFRELCLLSSRAILKGRYCGAFDTALRGELLPTANWLRDDRLGGREQLRPIFTYLINQEKLSEAVREKSEAVALWGRVEQLARAIRWPDSATGEFVNISASYGHLLFSVVLEGWRVMAAGFEGERSGRWDVREISGAATRYRQNWQAYRNLAASPLCSSLYLGCYLFHPGSPYLEGLDDTVSHYAKLAEESIQALRN